MEVDGEDVPPTRRGEGWIGVEVFGCDVLEREWECPCRRALRIDRRAARDEAIELDDTQSTDHFESLQSTNWQSLRFKPPPANSAIGWRVEFRPMEVQLTDFENAAFAVFIVLLSRAILHFNLNLYVPISKVRLVIVSSR